MAYHTFSHVLDLDISFHLERRTGALSRVLERGARTLPLERCSLADHPACPALHGGFEPYRRTLSPAQPSIRA